MDRAHRIPLADVRLSLAEEGGINPSLLVCVEGCDVGCIFCNRPEGRGLLRQLDAKTLRRLDRLALESGAVALQLTGGEPLKYSRALAELLAHLTPPHLPVVLNTSLLVRRDAVLAVAPHVDRVIAGAKFGNPECAARLSRVPDACSLYWENLAAVRALGIPLSLRFLVIPGHLDCCLKPLLERAAREAPGVPVTLLAGFMPPTACPEAPELLRLLAPEEVEQAVKMADDAGVTYWMDSTGKVDCRAPSPPNPSSTVAAQRLVGSGAPSHMEPSRTLKETGALELIIDAEGRICFSTYGPVAIELTARAFGRREDDPS